MASSNSKKTNGARLIRLIFDEGTATLRKYFDSKVPPATLTAVLTTHKATLNDLHTKAKVIKDKQMNLLFPPTGMPPTTSRNYDITLLFVLIRNICGVTPPASTGWNTEPLSSDTSEVADLIRIKNYRNEIFHRKSTEVDHSEFLTYWNKISEVLVRRGANAEDIVKLQTGPIEEDYYISLIIEARDNTRIIMAVIFFMLGVFCFKNFPQTFSYKEEYPMPQNFSSPGFVGREWVFRQMDEILNASDTRGVLLVADPGWGKSTIMKHLISSSSSSAVIHENIIGYHFCKYDDESTRDGKKFVKKLVPLIGKKISDFRTILEKDGLIRNAQQFNCEESEPLECFQMAIVDPLKKLDSVGRKKSFILIDALDECLDKEGNHQSIIVNILYRKASDLPNWVKLIVTSRNHEMTTDKMSKINLSKLVIDMKQKHNKQDLRTYAEKTLLHNITTETSSSAKMSHIKKLLDYALKFSDGNFLFLETIIKYWQKYPDKINPESIPESLQDIYATSFTERFKEINLDKFEPFLEILLASTLPPTLSQLKNILEYHFGKSYNTRKVANALSECFKTAIDQGPLEFHHQFFAEWLVNQTEGKAGIVINKPRGHQYIFDYLLSFYEERQSRLTFEELSELCAHFLNGKKTSQSNVRKLGSLKVSEFRNNIKRCILHDLASKRDATKLLAEFVKQFNSVDIPDYRGWTPAMYAVKAGNYENVKLFIDNKANLDYVLEYDDDYIDFTAVTSPDDFYRTYSSMISIATQGGYSDILNLLIERGANTEMTDESGLKPLHFLAVIGKFEMVKALIDKSAQLDVISLHHAAQKNHIDIVSLFLDAGLRDECLPCKSETKSWCNENINNFHLCMCETALHAAVSINNLEMTKLILQYGNTSVNCRHGSGRTALMEAFSQKNIQVVELLINAGADINAECKSPLSQLMYNCCITNIYNDTLYNRYCEQLVCDGKRVIDFSFAYGLWKVMTPFISNEKFDTSSDNARRNLAAIAGTYDQVDFINATYGYRMRSIPNIEIVLRYVAVCHSVRTLEHLLYSEDVSKFTTVYEDGKTLLHLAILGSVETHCTEVYITQSCPSSACICPKITHADIADEKRLETVMLLTKVLTLDINKQDKYGRTALHYAAVQVLPQMVKYLINEGADWSVKDKDAETALEYALRERPYVFSEFLPCQLTSDRVFEVCQSNVFDELANYLLKMENITECNMRAENVLRGLVYHILPLSLYSLFKSGLDVNCCARLYFPWYIINKLIMTGFEKRDDLLEVIKIFQIDVNVVCNVPLVLSELHLMALVGEHLQIGNLFKPSVNNSSFPLQRFIANHPKGVEILNECYDKEGYLPIHRAVQGWNTFAFSWFIEIGVDITRKTKSGFTVLVLAIRRLLDDYYPISEFREDSIFEQILKVTKKKNLTHAFFQCNSDISPLHVAAIFHMRGPGVLPYIATLSPALSLTCTNSDGIQPVYLAYLYHHNRTSRREPLLELGVSPENERLFKYPKREVEYHLIYNFFFQIPQHDMRNMLNDDGFFKCPGINDFLPNKTEIQEHLKACSRRCWPSAFEASRKFSSNFPYLDIQNNISNPFTDKFMDIASHIAKLRFHLVKTFPFFSMSVEKNLWRKVTKAHSCAFRCSCFEIMKLLQEKFTSEPLEWWDSISSDRLNVGSFLFERMGWTNTSSFGDVKYRWPFRFLLKKALKKDKAYKYLQILNPKAKFGPWSDI